MPQLSDTVAIEFLVKYKKLIADKTKTGFLGKNEIYFVCGFSALFYPLNNDVSLIW